MFSKTHMSLRLPLFENFHQGILGKTLRSAYFKQLRQTSSNPPECTMQSIAIAGHRPHNITITYHPHSLVTHRSRCVCVLYYYLFVFIWLSTINKDGWYIVGNEPFTSTVHNIITDATIISVELVYCLLYLFYWTLCISPPVSFPWHGTHQA